MFSIFKVQSLDRLVLLAAFLLLLRGGLLALKPLYLVPEIHWWLVGERLLNGGMLYREVWEDLAPIPALFYSLFSLIAPRSPLVSIFAGLILTFIQALWFNAACTRTGVVEERSMLPAAMYALFASLAFDFCFFGPIQLGVTFLFPVMALVFRHIRVGIEEHKVYETGVWIGLASLCYLPLALFMLWPVVVFAFYTGTRPRWYAVLLIGFLFPFLVTALTFFFVDDLNGFLVQYLQSVFRGVSHTFGTFGYMTAVLAFPLALAAWAGIRVITARSFINYQVVCNITMIFFAILGLLTWVPASWRQPATFFPLVIPAAYFVAQWTYLVRNPIVRELVLVSLIAWSLFCIYQPYMPLPYLRKVYEQQGLSYRKPQFPLIRGKKVLVVGYEPSFYLTNQPATPYLNHRLAERLWLDSTDYQSNFALYASFRNDMPDVVLDENGQLDRLFRRMPLLARHYRKQDDLKGLWFRVPNPEQ